MARLQNTFEFIGNLNFGKEIVKETVFDSGWAKKQLSVLINETKSNGVFLSVEGGYNKTNSKPNSVMSFSKKLFGEKGGKIDVPWEERNEPYILDSIADYKKTIVDLTVDQDAKEEFYKLRNEIFNLETKEDNVTFEDREKLKELYAKARETMPYRYEFVHGLDVVDFFDKAAEKLKGKKFRVKGTVEVSHWKGKFYTNYIPSLFELVDDETPNKLTAQLDLYFTKNVADESMYKSDSLITYNTYIQSYDSSHKGDKFFPFKTVYNGKNYDMENPAHAAHLNLIREYTTVKGKYVWHMPFEVKIIRGAEVVELTLDSLTSRQRTMVELGFNKIEDFREKGQMFGDSIHEVRLRIPVVKNLGDGNNFSNGMLETAFVEEDLFYTPAPPKNETSTNKTDNSDTPNKPKTINFDELPF